MDAAESLVLKRVLKEAIIEVLQERSDLISEALQDALEDARLLQAMEDAREVGFAKTEDVLAFLGLKN